MLVLVPAVLVFLLLKDRLLPGNESAAGPSNAGLIVPSLAIGLVIGTYDGFFGPGTGTFLALAFHVGLRFNLLNASGIARLANLASNAGALAVFMISAKVLFPLAFFAAAAGIAGNLIGSLLAVKGGARVIKPFMAAVMVLLLAEIIRRRMGL